MDKRTKESITDFFKYFMNQIKLCCEAFPTCEGCPCSKEHTGCYFRSKSPKDWKEGEL